MVDSGLYYERPRFSSGLHDALGVTGLTKEERHDLSHEVFYHKNDYSLICLKGVKDCKDTVYIPPRRVKAAISGGGMDWINAADFLLGPRAAHFWCAAITNFRFSSIFRQSTI